MKIQIALTPPLQHLIERGCQNDGLHINVRKNHDLEPNNHHKRRSYYESFGY